MLARIPFSGFSFLNRYVPFLVINNLDDEESKAVERLGNRKMGKALEADAQYQAVRAEHDKIISHWECHYWGSSRIYCLVGSALAEAMKTLVKP